MIVNLDTRRTLARHPLFVHSRVRQWCEMILSGTNVHPRYDAFVLVGRKGIFLERLYRKYDVIFLNDQSSVCALQKPGGRHHHRLFLSAPDAQVTLLLPRGAIRRSRSAIGHRINVDKELAPELFQRMLNPVTPWLRETESTPAGVPRLHNR